jgi:hypothetical protein
MDMNRFEWTSGSDMCPHGYKRNSACPCVVGRTPEDHSGCRAIAFEQKPVEEVVPGIVTGPKILDRPEPGREAW